MLSTLPADLATVAILVLSWADTNASIFGRLWGRYTPPLPRRLPLLGLPLAARKSVAGFIAASVTGGLIAVGFWGWVAPLRSYANDVSWTWDQGLSGTTSAMFGGWFGLGLIGVASALISGVAEALGT